MRYLLDISTLIGMVLQRELLVSPANVVLLGILRNSQNLVQLVVAGAATPSPPAAAAPPARELLEWVASSEEHFFDSAEKYTVI
jgi:hypothetical protein